MCELMCAHVFVHVCALLQANASRNRSGGLPPALRSPRSGRLPSIAPLSGRLGGVSTKASSEYEPMLPKVRAGVGVHGGVRGLQANWCDHAREACDPCCMRCAFGGRCMVASDAGLRLPAYQGSLHSGRIHT